jgi:hypothetical protein
MEILMLGQDMSKTQELAETLAEKLQTLLSALQDVSLPVEVMPAYDAATKALDDWHRNIC